MRTVSGVINQVNNTKHDSLFSKVYPLEGGVVWGVNRFPFPAGSLVADTRSYDPSAARILIHGGLHKCFDYFLFSSIKCPDFYSRRF